MPYHEFEKDGKKYRAVIDEDYRTRGSYGYESEARAAEDEEIANLESGLWVALGIIVLIPCRCDCPKCDRWIETDSVWGCVVENSTDKIEEFALNGI